MPQIEVIVNPAGQTAVQTKGFVGPACREASQLVERALGQAADQQLTSEFYQGQASHQSVEIEGAGSSPSS
jgi:hypothetical protein